MGGTAPGGGQRSPASAGARTTEPALPSRPALTAEGVADLAAAAVRDGPGCASDTHLRAIREQRLLEAIAVAEDAPWAAELAREWAIARQEALDLLAIHGQHNGRVRAEADEVLDAMAAQLLTDPEAPGRLRRRLREALAGQQMPPWFDAALDPSARVGRLLAAGLLLPEVQAAAAVDTADTADTTATADTAGTTATADTTERIPRVAAPTPTPAAAAAPGVAAAAPVASAAGTERWSRASGALVAPALALLVAAAGLRWPVVTGAVVVLWVVVDRVVSMLADPFLRLVGGWPPTIRGWAMIWLPFRLLGVLLRGPWRLLGGLLLLVLWGVVVDRGLTWLHPVLGEVSAGVSATDPASFAASWFVPVAAAGIVWHTTRRRGSGPSLRGAAAVGAGLRSLPAGVAGVLLVPAVVLVVVAATTPAEQPWAPYTDHRAAVQAWLPGEGWWETGSGWWAGLTERLPGLGDVLEGVLPGDAASAPRWQVVDASALNVRAGPGTAEPVLDSLPRGTVTEGTGRTETVDGALWVELRRPDGGVGWASGSFLIELDG